MKLSIIVTVYNRERTLRRCVDSLLKQDLTEYEIILVDDGSTDGSRKIIEEYMAAVPEKVSGILKENGGVASARNAGLAAAVGEYITYVDSDDWLEENCLGRIYKAALENDWDILLFDAREIFPDGEQRRFPPFYDVMKQVKPGLITTEEYLLARPCPWNQWTKRDVWVSVFSEINFPDRVFPERVFPEGMLYEDLGTMPLLGLGAKQIGYWAEACYCYYQSEGSIMRTEEYRSGYDDIFSIMELLRKGLQKNYPEELEYLGVEHLLISGGKRYLSCGREDRASWVADEMFKTYPRWKCNKYVLRESPRKQFLAVCLYKKRFALIRILKHIKKAAL